MFKKNQRHLQKPLTSHLDELPEKLRKELENSWAGVFYREFFCRLDEAPFAVLYADTPLQPNVPVKIMIGLEYLKKGNDWTDEEMYDHYLFNIQTRYALGLVNLGEMDFELRTVYNFRQKMSRYMQETGINLLDKALEQVTEEQIKAYSLKTGKKNIDSTQVANNIHLMGRIQLLVEVLQRTHRMLSEDEQAQYEEVFEPYLFDHAGEYIYRVRMEDYDEYLQRIGSVMNYLLAELKDAHGDDPVYQVLARVFDEHFTIEEAKELSIPKPFPPTSPQS